MTCIERESGQLYYFKYGDGDKILLAFHGFGQNNKIFKDWVKEVGHEYTIYAFDLFHHGSSQRENERLSKAEWKSYLKSFLTQEKINSFSIVGFSLGGRFAIASALALPELTKEITLIAPDGVFLTIWFKLATNRSIKWIFKYVMLQPNLLEKLMRFNDKYRVVSPYLGDFVRKELGDHDNRRRVYISWNNFKSLGYSKKQLSRLFQMQTFERRIILGSRDHIIKPEKILPIIETMGRFKVEVLPLKHHQLIKPEVAKLILNRSSK
ncbi:alpha/beta hydrolase [Ekhidna sp. To15]|uniref:alpha/beta hydrolase n=1 Tax=Ekhidna sp. To15 TaxID=3395267 RepID=UPI003F5231AF